MRSEAFLILYSRLPIPDRAGYRGPTGFRSPRLAHSPPYARHDTVTRISPPAPRVHRPSSGNGFLRRRRVLVELRSPVGTRQKPIRAGSPPSAHRPHDTRTPLSSFPTP